VDGPFESAVEGSLEGSPGGRHPFTERHAHREPYTTLADVTPYAKVFASGSAIAPLLATCASKSTWLSCNAFTHGRSLDVAQPGDTAGLHDQPLDGVAWTTPHPATWASLPATCTAFR